MRLGTVWIVASLVIGGAAHAQPGEPAEPPPEDPVLAEQVAGLLVQRAQELFDANVYAEARQLATEALAKRSTGQAADQARLLIRTIDERLGAAAAQPPVDPTPPDSTPIGEPAGAPPATPTTPGTPETPGEPDRSTVWQARVHAGMYAGLLGATIGAFVDRDSPASGAVPLGLGAGLAGGYYLPQLIDKLDWNAAQIRTAGLGITWGGVLGGLIGDVAVVDRTRASHVLVGASIGATVGGGAGALLARRDRFTRGDVALADTLAGVGAAGGLALGMLMQPPKTEAYAVNAALGAAAGLAIGLVAAPRTNTTERRMLRVAGLAAAGGAVPFLLYAGIYSGDTANDERVTGLLSSVGLAAGTWLGFRLTRGMDAGEDVRTSDEVDDAPPAVVGRHSDGRWRAGAIAVQPLSPVLAPQPGLAVPLVGATF